MNLTKSRNYRSFTEFTLSQELGPFAPLRVTWRRVQDDKKRTFYETIIHVLIGSHTDGIYTFNGSVDLKCSTS
jgi:hypothetical protein